MAANVQPIFPISPNIGRATLTTQDTSKTAPTTQGAVVMTGGANGTKIDGMKIRALGTNVATVLRVFFNDGQGTAASNFSLFYEKTLPATTDSAVAETGTDILLLPVNYDGGGSGNIPPYLDPNQKLYVSLGTTVAAGYAVTVFGGDY